MKTNKRLLFTCNCMNTQVFDFNSNRQICVCCGTTYENNEFKIPTEILDSIELFIESNMK